jgi:hypothetical protein
MENGKERERERSQREFYKKKRNLLFVGDLCSYKILFQLFCGVGWGWFGRWLVLLVAVVVSPSRTELFA